jgi:hypothetical protein
LDSSVIEYIDPDEQNFAMIALRAKNSYIMKDTKIKFTHCEIHPSTIFGVLASCIPFPEHNQAPRNTYQCLDINELVLMGDGTRKKICNVEVGDEVVSFNPETFETSITKVTHQYVRETDKKIYNVKPKDPNAPKKERTEAQKMAWEKALATRQANRENRKTVKETENERIARELKEKKDLAKKQVEDKIVKKAISIKKKAIKKEIILDEVSDDETPIEEIKQIVKKAQLRQQPPRQVNQPPPVYQKPKIIFM